MAHQDHPLKRLPAEALQQLQTKLAVIRELRILADTPQEPGERAAMETVTQAHDALIAEVLEKLGADVAPEPRPHPVHLEG
jgi:hypothetical protein